MSLIAMPASAQGVTPERPFAIGGVGAFSAGQGDTGGSVGGAVTFDVSNRITAEARGIFGDRGSNKNGVEVSGTMLVTLARSARTTAYVGAGGGMYHTTFDFGGESMHPDLDHEPFGQDFRMNQVPRFYADRLSAMMAPNGRTGSRSFTDPALTFGGGLRIDLTSRIFVAPDVRGLIVLSRGDHMTLVTMGATAGVRF